MLQEVYFSLAGSRTAVLASLVLSPSVVMAHERIRRAECGQPCARGPDAFVHLAAGPRGVAPLLELAESLLRLLAKQEQLKRRLAGLIAADVLERALDSASTFGQCILRWLAPIEEPLGEPRGLFGGSGEEVAAQLAAAHGLAATALKLARQMRAQGGEGPLFAEVVVLSVMRVGTKVLLHHPTAASRQHNLTQFLR